MCLTDCSLLLFCSDEEVILVQSSPEVVEVPLPPLEVVEVPPLAPQRGPRMKMGKRHPTRE